MNLTDGSESFDKENINSQNASFSAPANKKKIVKSSICNRYRQRKTIESIKRLTSELRTKLEGPKHTNSYIVGTITMENCRKKERFICYEDNKTF